MKKTVKKFTLIIGSEILTNEDIALALEKAAEDIMEGKIDKVDDYCSWSLEDKKQGEV